MPFEHTIQSGALVIAVKAVPGSSRSRIVGLWGNKLRIAIAAPPEKGKANKELIRFLAKALNLSRGDIRIVAGEHDPQKRIRLTGADPDHLVQRLQGLLPR